MPQQPGIYDLNESAQEKACQIDLTEKRHFS